MNNKTTFLRTPKNRGNLFVRTSKALIDDERLSVIDIGIMNKILSKPDDWILNKGCLQSASGIGEILFNNSWDNLKECGYITQKKVIDNRKVIGWEYTIIEKPIPRNQGMDLEPQKQDNPDIDIENPYLEKPYMVNHPNTNKGSTNKPEEPERIPSVDGVRTEKESASTAQKNIGPIILGPKEKNKIEQPQPEEKEIDDICLSSTTPPMVVVDENIGARIEGPNQKVEDLFQTEEEIEGNNNSNKVNLESMKQNEMTPTIDISGYANVDTEVKIPNRGQMGSTGSSGVGPLGRITGEDRNKFRMSKSFEKYFENDNTPYSEFQKEHPEIKDLSEDEATDLYIEWMLDRFILKRWNENTQEKNFIPSRESEPKPVPEIIGPNSKYPRVPEFLENGIMISSGQVYYPFSLKMITGPQSMSESHESRSVGKELLKSIQKEMVAQRKLYNKNKDAILNNLFVFAHKEKLKILNEGEFLNYLNELKLTKDQKKTIWNNAQAIRKFVTDLQYYEQAIKNVKLAFTV